jgi:hypothetical protein
MATYNKFNIFTENLINGVHNFSSDTLKVMLTNTVPVATNALYGDISGTELASGGGYTTGGTATSSNTVSTSSGTAKFVSTGPVFTATSGGMGPFRYAVLYDTTPTSPLKPLIAWWDYGSSISLLSGETFTVSFDGTNGVFTVA